VPKTQLRKLRDQAASYSGEPPSDRKMRKEREETFGTPREQDKKASRKGLKAPQPTRAQKKREKIEQKRRE